MNKPTIQDIEQYDGEFLPVALISAFLETNPNSFRQAVKAKYVPYAHVLGNGGRVIVYKEAFLNYRRHGQVQIAIGTDLREMRKALEIDAKLKEA